ncbi:MAG: anhydro-N-acetylmuramic acid kinase [Rickettsiales bacterium]|nr:anhydro-N-acetylmuramic acid kinase [Rickettsiales bacterium]
MTEPVWALGLMSGTSLDGLDGALLKTDGISVFEFGPRLTLPMPVSLGAELRGLMQGKQDDWLSIEKRFTEAQVPLVAQLVAQLQAEQGPEVKVGCIGFHGQTIVHRPAEGITWQIGNGALLAEQTGIAVVTDFRRRDVAAGGQGAPLVPLYHAALAACLAETSPTETALTPALSHGERELYPHAILNIGGISNLTWLGAASLDTPSLFAMDCGPGNALLNDWMQRTSGVDYDAQGQLAATGRVDEAALSRYLAHPFFSAPPPKSLDRHDFSLDVVAHLSPADGAATLTALTALAVAHAVPWLPQPPIRWLVCGGGRHNVTMLQVLERALAVPVQPVEAEGWNGDSLEAEAFAYLSVRMLRGMPISQPETTGVQRRVSGGGFYSV